MNEDVLIQGDWLGMWCGRKIGRSKLWPERRIPAVPAPESGANPHFIGKLSGPSATHPECLTSILENGGDAADTAACDLRRLYPDAIADLAHEFAGTSD